MKKASKPKWFSLPTYVVDVILSLTVFLLLFSFRKFDFDGGHEGYLLTTAIAQSEGFQIYKEYFSLYGTILPWTQSIIVSFSLLNAAINLRILDSLLITLIFFLILNLRRFINYKKQSVHHVLLFSAMTWVFLAYFFNGMSQQPWSSTMALSMQLTIINLLFWMLNLKEANRHIYVPIFGIAILLTILPLTRLNVGIATIISTYFILFTVSKENKTFCFSRARILAINLTGFAAFILYLVKNNSFFEFFEQSILIPRRVFTSPWMIGPENWNAIPVITRYFFTSIPFVVIAISLVHTFNRIGARIEFKLEKYMVLIGTSLVGIFITSLTHFSHRGFWIYQRLIVFLMVFGIMVAIFTVVQYAVSAVFKSTKSNQIMHLQTVVIALFALSGIVQIFPTHDPRHIWWGLPLLILLVPLKLDLFYSLPEFSRGTMAYTVTIFVFASAVFVPGASKSLSVDRISLEFDTPFKGMQVTPDKYTKLKSEFTFLNKHLTEDSLVFFQCGVGETHWLASFDGSYHSKSPWFVDLSFYPGHPKPSYNATAGDQLIICGDHTRQNRVALEYGFQLIASSENLGIAKLKERNQ